MELSPKAHGRKKKVEKNFKNSKASPNVVSGRTKKQRRFHIVACVVKLPSELRGLGIESLVSFNRVFLGN